MHVLCIQWDSVSFNSVDYLGLEPREVVQGYRQAGMQGYRQAGMQGYRQGLVAGRKGREF